MSTARWMVNLLTMLPEYCARFHLLRKAHFIMADQTSNLSLPFIMPAQAQKHVTVNEALVRLDGLAQLRLQSISVTTPPVAILSQDAGVVSAMSSRPAKTA